MRTLMRAAVLGWVLLAAAPVRADGPAYVGRHVTTPEDVAAITQVTADFQKALINKDVKSLSALMFNSQILFASPASDEAVQRTRGAVDVNFDGIGSGGYPAFARFVAESKGRVEERFYNIKITQDGRVAWVIFDYEFLQDNKVGNYGVETWQMYKTGGDWKILSVVWSSHLPPK